MKDLIKIMSKLKSGFSGYQRDFYIQKTSKYLDTNLIKVLLGQRRVGKSYIMRNIISIYSEKYFDNIFYVNFEIDDFDKIKDVVKLKKFFDNYFLPNIDKNKKIWVFLDEIQELDRWEKFVNSLLAKYDNRIEIFVSGSNSNLLSSELSTYISGRYIEILVLPLMFDEYKKCVKNLDFFKYMNMSGLPETLKLSKVNDDEVIINYFRALKSTILLKDIVKRYKIKDIFLLEILFDFLVNNIGNLFSLNKIANKLKSSGIKTNHNTLGTYLHYLESTFLIYGVNRYDLKGKKILEIEKKYYINDHGFKNYMSSKYDLGMGNHLENYVFLLLKKYGYNIFVGKINNHEIDFIAEKSSQISYIQVSFDISNEKTFEREVSNFFKIKEKGKFLLIVYGKQFEGTYKGIQIIDIENFEKKLGIGDM